MRAKRPSVSRKLDFLRPIATERLEDRFTLDGAEGEFVSPLVIEAETAGHLVGSAVAGGWAATTAADAAGYLMFGPYTADVDSGSYTATYRLKIDSAVAANTPVATIDVFDFSTGTTLGTRVLTGGDFTTVGTYQDFTLDFNVTNDNAVLEFRTFFNDTADLTIDNVTIIPRAAVVFEAETDLAGQIGVVSGDSRLATTSADASGYLAFGPYTTDIDAGIYSATYRLQIGSAVAADTPVATIDIYDFASGERLAWRTLRAGDFASVGVYEDFSLILASTDDTQLEFRTYWYDAVDVKLDSVSVSDLLPTVFEAETEFGHQTGAQVPGGWAASVAFDAAGYLAFGPYSTNFDTGTYTANYRLQLNSIVAADTPIARIDVFDLESGKRLAVRNLTGDDFTSVGLAQDFALKFQTTTDDTNLEFRTFWYDTADLFLDSVSIMESAPLLFEGEFDFGHSIGASVGDGWQATVTADAAGYLASGPYVTELDAGVYTAAFNVSLDSAVGADTRVARIEVFDFATNTTLASRTLVGADFAQVGVDQEFDVNFQTTNDNTNLELRTFWFDTADLTLDKVRLSTSLGALFEGEVDFAHQVGAAADLGWGATVAADDAGYLAFGPYTTEVSAGAYAAGFRLSADGNADPNSVAAVIDVRDLTTGAVLGSRTILAGEFDADNVYQTFAVNFEAAAGSVLEFRTYFADTVDLNLDAVRIVPITPLRLEAEADLAHQIGVAVGDGWSATVSADAAGYLAFGPYNADLNAGDFTATFRLKADSDAAADAALVTIDVFDLSTNTTLATRTLLRSDFDSLNLYQDFGLDFALEDDDSNLEFRTFWHDAADITEDSVTVTAAADAVFAAQEW